MAHGQRRARAFKIDQPFSSLNMTLGASFTRNSTGRHRRDYRASQRSQDFTRTTPNTPTGPLYHDIDQLGKTVSEPRLTMQRAGLDGQPRPCHRRGGRRSRDHSQDQEEALRRRLWMSKRAMGREFGLLEVDWKEYDEESERPCYLTLLEKLNREL